MRASFDSSVIIKALRFKAGLQLANDDAQENQRCARAIEDVTEMIVCPVAWLEVKRFARPEELAHLAQIEARKRIEPIDDDVVNKTHALMRRRIQVWDKATCVRCGNVEASKSCKTCGALVAEASRLNDYIIVAHAESLGLERLYTVETSMLSIGEDAVAVKIMRPPGISGPLFDAPPQAAAAGGGVPRRRRPRE